jgi:hypothetical protein
MSSGKKPVRVLYSFPNKLGADRICYTAWQQVNWVAAAGADVTVFAGGVVRPLNPGVKAITTLARGRLRLPYKLLGSKRTLALHDYIVAGRLKNLADRFDIIHTWPSGALRTLKAAAELGIPTVLERPNAHTRFAIEVVKQECERLGLTMPPGHEHAENPEKCGSRKKSSRSRIDCSAPPILWSRHFLTRISAGKACSTPIRL